MRRTRLAPAVSLGFALLAGSASAAPSIAPAARRQAAVSRALGQLARQPASVFADANHAFRATDVVIVPDGAEHVRLERTYKRLRVIGGDLVVHADPSGFPKGISQSLGRGFDLVLAPRLDDEDAIEIALEEQVAALSVGTPTAELVVYARGARALLAHEVVVEGVQADGTPSELHVFIDAGTGDVLDRWEGIETAAVDGTGKGFFVGTVPLKTNSVTGGHQLKDPSRGNLYTTNMANKTSGNGTLFTDADNVWGSGLLSDLATTAVDAQYGTSVTWDYFLTVHGRNGIANDGVGAFNRVHYGRKYNNAFWSDSCFCMTYGDGDGTTFLPFDSLDVAGHEMTHGVTSRTARLVYSGESGGLNEATSDIFGALVELYANNARDPGDDLIGEKLYKSGTKVLRYMYNPALDGASKSCWSSTLGTLDVHYSSDPANHFFYLLAGGSSPASGPASPTCNGSSVTGIGRDAAGRIWYRALTTRFTSTTNYAAARAGTIAAATELFGAGSVEASAVAAAWSAVAVN